jgi:hypothetical protein
MSDADERTQRGSGHLELSFSPNLLIVQDVHEFVLKFCGRVLMDDDASTRLGLAAHELLENAVRYAEDGETGLRIDVKGDAGDVVLRTWNRASSDHLQRLSQLFAEMQSENDPFAHYLTLMHRAVRKKQGSGLGLARIRAEAGMSLSQTVSEGALHLVATMNLRGEATP